MKAWLIILIVFLVIIFIVGIIALLYFVAKKKDIKRMKNDLAIILKTFGAPCKEPTKYADCAVDKLIDGFGFGTVMKFNNKGWDTDTFFKKKSDKDKANDIMNKCKTSYC
jgi:hypothetical protein